MIIRWTPVIRTIGASLALMLPLVLGGCSVGGAPPPQSSVQKAEPEAAPTEAAASPVEGLTVHGHWTIEVRDPDGTLVERREFENALASGADLFLVNIMGRLRSVGGWRVVLVGAPAHICDDGGGGAVPCEVAESTDAQVTNETFHTLTVTTDIGPPNAVVLSGSVVAQRDGDISTVQTVQLMCSSATTPDNCPGGFITQSGNLTSTTLGTPIAVLTGQQVQVNVRISFS
jgi:hypothetical protein